jgi:DNA-binding transcriptional ArsR family regulator
MKRITDPDALLLQGAADPTRLAILRQLAGSDEVCACEFTSCCDVGQPTVSHHLKVLRDAGWVSSERRGSWVWYRLRPEAVTRFRQIAGEFGGMFGSPDSAPRARTLSVIHPPPEWRTQGPGYLEPPDGCMVPRCAGCAATERTRLAAGPAAQRADR